MKQPFEQAVHEHGPTVLRVCRAVLGAGPDADDAWSETFLAALRAWPDLAADTNVQAWLVRVARRKAIDIVRTRSRQAVPADPTDPAGGAVDQESTIGNPDPDDIALWHAVAELPERQRLSIAYHYFGGLPHTETAQLVGGTPEAVRRAAADGIKTLRRTLTAGQTRHGEPR